MSIGVAYKEDKEISRLKDEALLDSLKQGRKIDICVRGISMYPAIKDYDCLTLEPIIEKECEVGDIIAVKSDLQSDLNFFIHRLVKIESINNCLAYFTKGDNSSGSPEGPFWKENIIGRAISIKRKKNIINLRSGLAIYFSRFLAILSFNVPLLFKAVNYTYCLLLERSSFTKILKRIRNQDSLNANTQELILLLSSIGLGAQALDRARTLIREGIRWNNFCEIAISNGRIGFTLKNLKTLRPIIEIPQFVLERLENARLQTTIKSIKNHNELLFILKNFSDEGIPMIPLKGTYLSEILYGDISERAASADLDLLIKEKDLERSLDLARRIGYRDGPENEISAWRWCEDLFRDGFSPIDLHWDITMMNRNSERINGLWQDAKRVDIQYDSVAANYYQWSNEALLLYLCVNLISSKGYRNLRNFFDIQALIERSKSFSWQSFVADSYKYKISNSIYASLSKTKQLLGVEVPTFVLGELRPCFAKRVLIDAFLNRRVIFQNCIRRKFLDGFLSYIFFELLEADSLRDFLRITKRVLLPPKEIIEMALNDNASSDKQSIITNSRYLVYILNRFFKAFYKVGRSFLVWIILPHCILIRLLTHYYT